MAALPRLSNRTTRALFLDRHGLLAAPAGPGRGADLARVIGNLGFVQIDSINTVVRAHHMILHARRTAYRPGNLHLLHDRDRGVFEHWTHDASMIDISHFPHWRLGFRRHEAWVADHWRQKGKPAFADKLDAVLRQIAVEGPRTSAEVGAKEARPTGGWWDWHPSKAAMEHLWRTGRLSVTRRAGFRKVYDLTENVIPEAYLRAHRDEAETVEWACGAALDRLGFATPGEIAALWALVSLAEARAWAQAALARGDLTLAEIEHADGRSHRSLMRP